MDGEDHLKKRARKKSLKQQVDSKAVLRRGGRDSRT